MRHVTFYDIATGALHAKSVLVSDDSAVALNIPAGHEAIDHPQGGMLDSLSQRVDVERLAREDSNTLTAWSGEGERPKPPVATAAHVIDYQPPQPSQDHEWNATTKRWGLTAAVRRAQQAKRATDTQIRELRDQAQDFMRRLSLDPNDAAARERLQGLHNRIEILKGRMGKINEEHQTSTGTHETLGAHSARILHLEEELVDMRADLNERLTTQDTALDEIKEMIAMAKGGLTVLAQIGAWAFGIASLIHAIPTVLSWIKNKP